MKYDMFRLKSPDFAALRKYGFEDENGVFKFQTSILNGEFTLLVFIESSGEIDTKLIDNSLNEQYVLHLNESATGSFVGQIRQEIEDVLKDIASKCFYDDVFKSAQAKEVITYISNKYGDRLEFLWEKSPDIAIWRRKDTQKWYGIIFVLDKNKLDKNASGQVDIINLHLDPGVINMLVDNKSFFRSYHMNKKHWITICLDGTVELKQIFKFVDESYFLAKK